jgi:hypothetical protein
MWSHQDSNLRPSRLDDGMLYFTELQKQKILHLFEMKDYQVVASGFEPETFPTGRRDALFY